MLQDRTWINHNLSWIELPSSVTENALRQVKEKVVVAPGVLISDLDVIVIKQLYYKRYYSIIRSKRTVGRRENTADISDNLSIDSNESLVDPDGDTEPEDDVEFPVAAKQQIKLPQTIRLPHNDSNGTKRRKTTPSVPDVTASSTLWSGTPNFTPSTSHFDLQQQLLTVQTLNKGLAQVNSRLRNELVVAQMKSMQVESDALGTIADKNALDVALQRIKISINKSKMQILEPTKHKRG